MILAALKGLIMAHEVPTAEEMVPSFLHAFMWASAFGAVEEFRSNRLWSAGGLSIAALTFHVVGIKWPQIKPIVGPRFASSVERIASNRLYRRVVYLFIGIALLLSIGFGVYRRYHPSPIQLSTPNDNATKGGFDIKPIQVSVLCTGDKLPIKVVPGKPTYVVMIYEDYNKRQKMALFYDLSAGLGITGATLWPNADRINAAALNELFTARCDFTNHGDDQSDNALSVKIPVKFEYLHNVSKDGGLDPKTMNRTSTTNDIVIGALDHGQTISFYFINNCYSQVIVNTPETATGKLVGESNARNFQLELPNEYSREGFQLGATHTNWGQMTPCIN